MLAKAAAENPRLEWRQADLATWRPDRPADIIYSNAALHWLDGHERLLPGLFAGLAPRFKALQWHGAEVAEAPPGATVLASSPACAVQAIRVGASAYGLQYHVELTDRTVAEWAEVPAYACALDATLGAGALPGFAAAAAAAMPGFNRDARRLYDNFMGLIRWRAA